MADADVAGAGGSRPVQAPTPREAIEAILAYLRAAEGPCRAADQCLAATVYPGRPDGGNQEAPAFTSQIGAARELHRRLLPDFWITSGLCGLTGHASTGPDYNGRNGEVLRAKWPVAEFDGGFHADLAPGDGPHRECFAILDVTLQAVIAEAALGEGVRT